MASHHPLRYYLRLVDDPFIRKDNRRHHSLPRLDKPGKCQRFRAPRSKDEAVYMLSNFKTWPPIRVVPNADCVTSFDFEQKKKKIIRFSFYNLPEVGVKEMRYSMAGSSFRYRMDDGRWEDRIINLKSVLGSDHYDGQKAKVEIKHESRRKRRRLSFVNHGDNGQMKNKELEQGDGTVSLSPNDIMETPIPNSPYIIVSERRSFGTFNMFQVTQCLLFTSVQIARIDRKLGKNIRIWLGDPKTPPSKHLPVEMWLVVFRFLSIRDRIKIRQVCSLFKQIVDQKGVLKLVLFVGLEQQMITLRDTFEAYHQERGTKLTNNRFSGAMCHPFDPTLTQDSCPLNQVFLSKLNEMFEYKRPASVPFENLIWLEVYLNDALYDAQIIDLSVLTRLRSLVVSGSSARIVNTMRNRLCYLHSLTLKGACVAELSSICPFLQILSCDEKQLELMIKEQSFIRPIKESSVKILNLIETIRQPTLEYVNKVFPKLEILWVVMDAAKQLLGLIRFPKLKQINVSVMKYHTRPNKRNRRQIDILFYKIFKRLHLGLNLDRIEFSINGFRITGKPGRFDEFSQYLKHFCFGAEKIAHIVYNSYWADKHRDLALRKVVINTNEERDDLLQKAVHYKRVQTLILNSAALNVTLIANIPNYCPMLTHLTLNRNPLLETNAVDDGLWSVNFLMQLIHLQSVRLIGRGFDYGGLEKTIRMRPLLTTVVIESGGLIDDQDCQKLSEAILFQARNNPHLRYVMFLPSSEVITEVPPNLFVF